MELRDHIASLVLPAVVRVRWNEPIASGAGLKEIPILAYAFADAMIKIREMKNEAPDEWATIVQGMLSDE